jgi:hypothetical protein
MSARRVRTVIMTVVGVLLIAWGLRLIALPSSYIGIDETLQGAHESADDSWFGTDELPLVRVHEGPAMVEAWRSGGTVESRFDARWSLAAGSVLLAVGVALLLVRRRLTYLGFAIGALVMSLLLANVGGDTRFGQLAAMVSFVAVIALSFGRVLIRRGGRRLGPSAAR